MPVFLESKAGTGPKSKNLLDQVSDLYVAGVNQLQKQRDDSKRWYDLVAGDMIPENVEARLKKKGLPAVKFNIVLPKIVRIMGAERETRAGIKAVPLRQGVNPTAQALTKLFEWIRINSDGLREIKDAWMDSIITDLGGFLEVLWTNDNDPLGEPIYRHLPSLYCVWDPKHRRYDMRDGRYIMKTWFATTDDIIRDFPDKAKEIKDALSSHTVFERVSGFFDQNWDRLRGAKATLETQFFNTKENTSRVIEAQLREEITELRLFDPVTQSVERFDSKEELKAFQSQNPRLIETEFKWDRIRIVTTVGGTRLLLQDAEADVQNGMFSIIPFWGFLIGGRSIGFVKNLEGPQELTWKGLSSALHIANSTANPVWVYPRGSLTPRQKRDLEQYGARTGFHIEYDPQEGQSPRREVANTVSTGILDLIERAEEQGEKVTGIGPNAIGRSDTSSESGKLVETRVSESLAMLETFFDNKMRSIMLLHQYLIAMIQTKMTPERVVRFVTDSGTPQELLLNMRTAGVIINDLKQGEYGVAIEKDQARYFRQAKLLKLLSLAEIMGANPSLLKMIVRSFDDLDEPEKEELIRAIEVQDVEAKAQQMEAELRQSVQESRQSLLQAGEPISDVTEASLT